MKLLFEASVVFQLHETDDGKTILGATLVTDELNPGFATVSAAALSAAAAYALFNDGTLNRTISEKFGVDMGPTLMRSSRLDAGSNNDAQG